MKVAVVVVSYRTGPPLRDCIDALSTAEGIDEIVLVDNGNDEVGETILDTACADPRVKLLRGQGNIGFGAGCNLGARATGADVLIFVNPDAILRRKAVVDLCEALSNAPPHALVGGDLRDGDGLPERGSRRQHLTVWRAVVAFTGLSRLERLAPMFRDFNRHTDPLPERPTRIDSVSGALMAIRRSDFQTLGGFDENYFLHVEDMDLCRRVSLAGWPVIFAPGPHGQHIRSTSEVAPSFINYHKARSMAIYLRKFSRGPLEGVMASLAGALIRVVVR